MLSKTSMRYFAVTLSLWMTLSCAAAQETDDVVRDTAFLAATTLDRQMRELDNRRVPTNLRAGAKCIAVFPSVVKAGLIIAAKHGNGLISCRHPDNGTWGTPAVFSVTAASVGIQAGLQNASYIMLFMTDAAVEELLEASVAFGSEFSIVAGPVGAASSYADMPSVISYVRTLGLFAGVDLQGAKVSFATSANASLYGSDATAPGILFGDSKLPLALEPFHSAIKEFGPEL